MSATTSSSHAHQGPRIIACQEHGPINLPLSQLLNKAGALELNSDIERGDFFAVHLKGGALTLQARSYVGYIPLTRDVVIYVRPRAPVHSLLRMMQVSGAPPHVLTSLRTYATDPEWSESLLGLYTDGLLRQVDMITATGLLQEYRRRDEDSTFPCGRVLLQPTVQRFVSRGVRHRARVAWFERTRDNAPNRCLKHAIWLLAEKYRQLPQMNSGDRTHIRRLNTAFAAFGGVSLEPIATFIHDPLVTGRRPLPALRAYYRDALTIALAVIQQRAVLVEEREGLLSLPSLALDMNQLFESYVRSVLRRYAAEEGWPATVEDGNGAAARGLYDDQATPEATPDIVVRSRPGATPLVLEVKNIPIRSMFSGRHETNQAITYALGYRAPIVVLVHPRASEFQPRGLHHLGNISTVSVYQYRFDLGTEDLVSEERRFGIEMRQLFDQAIAQRN